MPRAGRLPPGGFYARQKRPPSARVQADIELSARIAEINRRSRATYGAPRIHAELEEQGIRVGCKRVVRLMRAARLKGVSRRNWMITTVRDRAARPAPDLVERNFSAPAPNRLWVAAITYIPTRAGFLNLAVVLDAFSRRIVGWAIETCLRTELVLKELDMAFGQRRPAGVIHHYDQGSYTPIAAIRRSTISRPATTNGLIQQGLITAAQHRLPNRGRSSRRRGRWLPGVRSPRATRRARRQLVSNLIESSQSEIGMRARARFLTRPRYLTLTKPHRCLTTRKGCSPRAQVRERARLIILQRSLSGALGWSAD